MAIKRQNSVLPAMWTDDYDWYVAHSLRSVNALRWELTGEEIDPDDLPFERVSYWRELSRWDGEIGEGKLRTHWVWVWIFVLRNYGFFMTTEC